MKNLEKKIVFVLFVLCLLFLHNTNISQDAILTINFSGISIVNILLFALFFSLFFAIISASSMIAIDKKNMTFTGLLVFIGLFALIGWKISIIYSLLFSFLVGCCFFWFMNNISKEIDEYKHVNYIKAFIIMKSNMYKCFFLIGILSALLTVLIALQVPNLGEKVLSNTFAIDNEDSEHIDNIMDIAKDIRKQSDSKTADATRFFVMHYVYEDNKSFLTHAEKNACLKSINNSDVYIKEKINETYSNIQLNSEDMPLTQNRTYYQANILIKLIKNYYFIIAGFFVFFIISFCGSIIALVSSLIGIIILKGTRSLDKKYEKNIS